MWRLAFSLATLRSQLNTEYPNRSRASDGTIGDAAHQAVPSDHNPNAQGVVCAMDITHHPGYLDAHALADRLIIHRHPNLKYIISNNRIAGAWTQWRWVRYAGSNPHDKHIHISVGVGEDGRSVQPYDDSTTWNIKEEEVKATDAQIDATISYIHYAYFGTPAPDAVFQSWRGLLKNNYVEGLQTILTNTDPNPGALKNNALRALEIKDKVIKDLEAKLAIQSEDTELLNGFGQWLTKIIARLGLKK